MKQSQSWQSMLSNFTKVLIIAVFLAGPNLPRSAHQQNTMRGFNLVMTLTLFSVISGNWAGEPLVSYETMLKFIRTSKTKTGFCGLAYFGRKKYQPKCQVSQQEKENLNLRQHNLFPVWNYTLKPHTSIK